MTSSYFLSSKTWSYLILVLNMVSKTTTQSCQNWLLEKATKTPKTKVSAHRVPSIFQFLRLSGQKTKVHRYPFDQIIGSIQRCDAYPSVSWKERNVWHSVSGLLCGLCDLSFSKTYYAIVKIEKLLNFKIAKRIYQTHNFPLNNLRKVVIWHDHHLFCRAPFYPQSNDWISRSEQQLKKFREIAGKIF